MRLRAPCQSALDHGLSIDSDDVEDLGCAIDRDLRVVEISFRSRDARANQIMTSKVDAFLTGPQVPNVLFVGHGAIGTHLFCALSDIRIDRRVDQGLGGEGCWFEFDLQERQPWRERQPMKALMASSKGLRLANHCTTVGGGCSKLTLARACGLNAFASRDAVAVMGEDAATMCVLILDANRDRPGLAISYPGGYFRSITRAADRGDLYAVGRPIGP